MFSVRCPKLYILDSHNVLHTRKNNYNQAQSGKNPRGYKTNSNEFCEAGLQRKQDPMPYAQRVQSEVPEGAMRPAEGAIAPSAPAWLRA